MMELLVDLGVLVLLLTLLVGWLAAWRIGQVVSWRALAKTAWLTRSFTDCVAFLRFCVEERELTNEHRPRVRRVARERSGSGHVLEELPRAS
jgi:hypothetical protein